MGLGRYFSFRNILSTAILACVLANVLDMASTTFNMFSWPNVVETTPIVADAGGDFLLWPNAVEQKLIVFAYYGLWAWLVRRSTKNNLLASIPLWYNTYEIMPLWFENMLLWVGAHNWAGPMPAALRIGN